MAQVKSFQEYIEKNFLAKLERSAEEYLYDHAGVLQVEREKDITLRDIDFSEAEVHRVWTEDSPGNEIDFAVIVRARYQGYGGDNKYGEPDDYEEWIQMDCKGDLTKNLSDFRVLDMSDYDYRNKPEKTLSRGLVPYMKRTELESYAKRLLDEFWPELYKDQIPVEPKVLAERMGLKVFERRLTSDLSVFGEMIFSPCSLDVYDEERKNTHKEVFSGGTILVDPDIVFIRGWGTKNTTIIHECVHWYYHRKAFELVRLFNEAASRIECHANGELKTGLCNNESVFIEWQANALPTYIMAPKTVLKLKVNELFNNYENERESDDYIDFIEDIIRDIADFFGLSKQAAKIRMIQCGFEIARGAFDYVDGHYVSPYQGKPGVLGDNETYSAGITDVVIACMFSPELLERIRNGFLIYIDSHLVEDNPIYIQREEGRVSLSRYARNHADECMVKFQAEIISSYRPSGFMLECILCRDNNPGMQILLKYDQSSNASIETKYAAFTRRKKDIQEALDCMVEGNLAESLEQLLEWADMSPEELAAKIYVEPKTVDRWLSGETKHIKPETAVYICIAMKLPYDVCKAFFFSHDIPLSAKTDRNALIDFMLLSAENNSISIEECKNKLEPKKKDSTD